MRTTKYKLSAIVPPVLFVMAMLGLFAAAAQAQTINLAPGEIVYGRSFNQPIGGNCSTMSVWAVGQDGSYDRQLFSNALHPRISPDGRFIMYERFGPSGLCTPFGDGAEIWLRELATGRETLITNFVGPYGTFFTPETNRADNQIIFDTQSVVCRVDLDGANRFCSNLGFPQGEFQYPTVRGGDYLSVVAALGTSPPNVGGLYTFNYNLTGAQKIPNTTRNDRNPSWSNDGQTIAYNFCPETRGNPYFFSDLYKINPDGSNKTRLTFVDPPQTDGFSHSLVWMTNRTGGHFIYNAARINGVAGIYKISTDGTGSMVRIPLTAGNDPDWVGGIVPVRSEQQTTSFGGGLTANGSYSLVSTLGQAFTGQTSTAAPYSFESGFWALPSGSPPSGTPTATPTNTPTATPTNAPTNTPTATPTVAPVLTGTVTYGNAPATRFVSNVTIGAVGVSNISTTTAGPGATSGQYSLTGFGSGPYIVTPSKTGGVNGITSFDAARIAQHVAGISLLTGSQLLVADVSNNGTVSSFDAAQISNFVVAASPAGMTGTWRFSPANRSYPSVTTDMSGQDYSALLMGEVSGNWTNTGAGPLRGGGSGGSRPEKAVTVGAPRLVTPADSEVLIPVLVEGMADKGVISYEFDLGYDPSVIQPQANPVDIAGTASRGLSVAFNGSEAGILRVAVYGPIAIDRSGVLLSLRFTAIGAPGAVSELSWDRMILNEGESAVKAVDGQVELSAAVPHQAEINGRLLSEMGQGIPHARITLTDTTGKTRSILSNGFGVYRFGGLQVGQTYTISVESKRFQSIPLTVSVTGEIVSVDMMAEP